jgi:hypothetical protein
MHEQEKVLNTTVVVKQVVGWPGGWQQDLVRLGWRGRSGRLVIAAHRNIHAA